MINPVPQTQVEFPLRQLVSLLVSVGFAIAVVLLGVHFYRMHDPYVQQVMANQGNVEQGQEIFQVNCAACHGIRGDGVVGPSLRAVSDRKSKLGIIHQVISGETPPMPKFQPSPETMADLLSYLESL